MHTHRRGQGQCRRHQGTAEVQPGRHKHTPQQGQWGHFITKVTETKVTDFITKVTEGIERKKWTLPLRLTTEA